MPTSFQAMPQKPPAVSKNEIVVCCLAHDTGSPRLDHQEDRAAGAEPQPGSFVEMRILMRCHASRHAITGR